MSGVHHGPTLEFLEFIGQKKDIILIGNPRGGKSFVAKSIAYAATQAGIKTLFTTATDMINHLFAAEADHSLLKKLHYLRIVIPVIHIYGIHPSTGSLREPQNLTQDL